MPPKTNNTRKKKRKPGTGDPDETTNARPETGTTAPDAVEDGQPGSVPPDGNPTADQDEAESTAVRNMQEQLQQNNTRDLPQQNAAPIDPRYLRNAQENREALDKIYDFYYQPDGSRRSSERRLNALYGLMSKETSGYLKEGVSIEDLRKLEAIPGAKVKSQKVSAHKRALKEYDDELDAYPEEMKKYRAELEAYNRMDDEHKEENPPPEEPEYPIEPTGPENNSEALADGDYFHVINTTFSVSRKERQKRARRLVVNLKTQQATLKVADALGALFQDSRVAPYLSEFKVLLSSIPDSTKKVKYDKIVVYYVTAPADAGDADRADKIGDRLVDTIESSITEDDVVDKLAPFYSWVGPGVAWAEEPKYYIEALTGSFTTTRSDIIAEIIKGNDYIRDKDTFVKWVAGGMLEAQVDPVSPHRHVPPPDGPPPPDEANTAEKEVTPDVVASGEVTTTEAAGSGEGTGGAAGEPGGEVAA